VVIRPAAGAADVKLDCLQSPLTGWQPIGSRYEYTRVDVQHGGMAVGSCSNGRHEMTSTAPFGVTVWGWDGAVSYAYPAGAGVRAINTIVVPAIPR
jgi:IgGFc binding protein